MYDFVQGELAVKSPTAAVILAGGIGYRIHIPVSSFEALPDSGEVKLWTYLYVREDQLRLYGFATPAERELFELLISVRGIGPAVALLILSNVGVNPFRAAVANGEIAVIQRIRGIGRKTAERIMLELRERIQAPDEAEAEPVTSTVRDAVKAMISLGYKDMAAEKAVQAARQRLGEDVSLEALVREALRSV